MHENVEKILVRCLFSTDLYYFNWLAHHSTLQTFFNMVIKVHQMQFSIHNSWLDFEEETLKFLCFDRGELDKKNKMMRIVSVDILLY